MDLRRTLLYVLRAETLSDVYVPAVLFLHSVASTTLHLYISVSGFCTFRISHQLFGVKVVVL